MEVEPSKLFQPICHPNSLSPFQGSYFAWKATAIGKNFVSGKAFLEKRYNEQLELEDAVHTAILTLKESFEGGLTLPSLVVWSKK